jgi:large subunit ribosomal protein L15
LPKRGFRVPFPVKGVALNVASLERFDANSEVGELQLREVRLVQGRVDKIKILGHGDISKPLTVTAHEFSASARLKIEAAGGKVVVLSPPAAAGEAPSAEG